MIYKDIEKFQLHRFSFLHNIYPTTKSNFHIIVIYLTFNMCSMLIPSMLNQIITLFMNVLILKFFKFNFFRTKINQKCLYRATFSIVILFQRCCFLHCLSPNASTQGGSRDTGPTIKFNLTNSITIIFRDSSIILTGNLKYLFIYGN